MSEKVSDHGILAGRRAFLRGVAGAALSGAGCRVWAVPATSQNKRLIILMLRGGYDSLSALVPYGDNFYYEARPSIAIPKPDAAADGLLTIDDRWGLAPALRDGVGGLFKKDQIAFVPFAGAPFVSRSHFQAQDFLEYGRKAGSRQDYSSGFMNRLLAEIGGHPGSSLDGVSFTQNLTPIFQGPIRVGNSPPQLPRKTSSLHYQELVESMYAGHPLQDVVMDGLGLRRKISAEVADEMSSSSRGALPPSAFATQASGIGRLLRHNPQYGLVFMDVGGWDTHVAQGGASGQLASRLRGLSLGIGELVNALGPDWKNTVLLVVSEFGRTFRENGNRGTDHGHGSAIWVLGGSIFGGRVLGEQTQISRAALHQDRDLPVMNDYRAVFGGVFQRMYGLNADAINRVFPEGMPANLGLI